MKITKDNWKFSFKLHMDNPKCIIKHTWLHNLQRSKREYLYNLQYLLCQTQSDDIISKIFTSILYCLSDQPNTSFTWSLDRALTIIFYISYTHLIHFIVNLLLNHFPKMDLIHQIPLVSLGASSLSGGGLACGVLWSFSTSYPSSLAFCTSILYVSSSSWGCLHNIWNKHKENEPTYLGT